VKIKLPITQEGYDEWYAYHLARVDNKEFYFVDLNDAVMVYVAATHLANKYPDKREAIVNALPDALDRAMKDLGMFMGAMNLARIVGLDPQEGQDAMVKVVRSL
jgi:hypothetical protein